MKLDDFLKERGLTSPQFGKIAGIRSKQTIHNYRHGMRFPTPENLWRIREAINGAVTANDFVDQHTSASPPLTLPAPAAPKPRTKRSAAASSTPPISAPLNPAPPAISAPLNPKPPARARSTSPLPPSPASTYDPSAPAPEAVARPRRRAA